jgi:hypothetical protein
MRVDHLVLVQQRQAAAGFQHALDHEHHIGTAGIIFVEHQRHGILQRPGQQAFAEFGHLLAVTQHDGILADQVDAADMAVQIDADAGPVEPRRHLLDMRGLAGTVIALNHDAAVVGETGQQRQRGLAVEAISGVDLRHMLASLREGGHLHGGLDAEQFGRIGFGVGHHGGIQALEFAHVTSLEAGRAL